MVVTVGVEDVVVGEEVVAGIVVAVCVVVFVTPEEHAISAIRLKPTKPTISNLNAFLNFLIDINPLINPIYTGNISDLKATFLQLTV